jgi:uncharacterized membrane protein
MIDSPWLYVAVILLCAGLFPFLEQRLAWRIFKVLPSIVLTYLLVTALSVLGFWQLNPDIEASQKLLLSWLLPALMFLLLVSCDFKAILALGPRILAGFCCSVLSILLAITLIFSVMKSVLPSDAWQTFASVGGGWIGGTANLVGVSQALQSSPNALSNALLMDALCYSVWVLVLFASVPLQAAFNRKTKASAMADHILAKHGHLTNQEKTAKPLDLGLVLLWLGVALLVGNAAHLLADTMPKSEVLTPSSWTLLIATLLGLLASYTPIRKLPGSMALASALLAIVVATIASKASFSGISTAPWFVLSGLMILALHGVLMAFAARLFHFDLSLCGISSLACVGGVASAPLLAVAYSPVLAPVGVLLAMLGYVLGTGGGLVLASLLKPLGL